MRRFIGYVPQALSADGDLTGYENLLMFCKLIGISGSERPRRIQEILEMMDLTEAAHRRVKQYSGGMVRRGPGGWPGDADDARASCSWTSRLSGLTRWPGGRSGTC